MKRIAALLFPRTSPMGLVSMVPILDTAIVAMDGRIWYECLYSNGVKERRSIKGCLAAIYLNARIIIIIIIIIIITSTTTIIIIIIIDVAIPWKRTSVFRSLWALRNKIHIVYQCLV